MSCPTWHEAEQYAKEAKASGDTQDEAFWTELAVTMKDCTYDAGLYPDATGKIVFDSGRIEEGRGLYPGAHSFNS